MRCCSPVNQFNLVHRLTRKQDRLFDRLRDRRALEAAGNPGTAATFDALEGEEYALVVTFRRSGQPVPTPMWFGLRDGRAYVRSLADAGKIKRLRHNPGVRVAPCTVRGRPTGPFADGVARILTADKSEIAEAALDRHYGLRRRLYESAGSRLGVQTVYVELVPRGATAASRQPEAIEHREGQPGPADPAR